MTKQVNNQRHKYHPLTAHYHNDSEDDDRSGCRNVSHCHQQFFSELHSPGRSHYTNYFIYCKFDRLISDVCVAHCIRRLPPIPFSLGTNLGGDCFFFFFNSLQEPITRSLHLPYYSSESTLSRIFLILEAPQTEDFAGVFVITNHERAAVTHCLQVTGKQNDLHVIGLHDSKRKLMFFVYRLIPQRFDRF